MTEIRKLPEVRRRYSLGGTLKLDFDVLFNQVPIVWSTEMVELRISNKSTGEILNTLDSTVDITLGDNGRVSLQLTAAEAAVLFEPRKDYELRLFITDSLGTKLDYMTVALEVIR